MAVASTADHKLAILGAGPAHRHKRRFDRIIGCYDPDVSPKHVIRFHRQPAPNLLVLKFVDLDFPPPPPHDERKELQLATREQVEQALAFDSPGESLLIHCHAGISRSTAVAYAILAARLGPGAEAAAIEALYSLQPNAVPNRHIVALADEILGRGGALLAALDERELGDDAARTRRTANRQSYFDFYGCGALEADSPRR
jgi:predicted protein tyrosine phosphatase